MNSEDSTQPDPPDAAAKQPTTEAETAGPPGVRAEQVEVGFSVYGVVDAIDWSPHEETLGRWKQGDLLRDVPLTWVAPSGIDPVTGLTFEADDEAAGAVTLEGTYDVIVCSQTCDLGAGPPGDNHPFVLVAPLIHEDGFGEPKRRSDAAKGMLGHLVRTLPAGEAERDALLTAAREQQVFFAKKAAGIDRGEELPEEVLAALPDLELRDVTRGHGWYADLRCLVSVSKGLLVTRNPIDGFLNEQESLDFGDALAHKFRRPALHEALSEELPEALERYIFDRGAKRQAFLKVEQVRLHIIEGSRLDPLRGALVVLTANGALTDAEQEEWAGLDKAAAAVFEKHGFTYGPLTHWNVPEMSAALYRNTVPVRCRYLRTPRWM